LQALIELTEEEREELTRCGGACQAGIIHQILLDDQAQPQLPYRQTNLGPAEAKHAFGAGYTSSA
jgi:hypothetical protein